MIASINFSEYYGLGPIGSVPIELALEKMISDPNWLPGYNFTIKLIDDQCVDNVMIQQVFSIECFCSSQWAKGSRNLNSL